MRGSLQKTRTRTLEQEIRHRLARAEAEDVAKGPRATHATGATLLRLRPAPVDWLIGAGKISQLEFQAARDINIAVMAMAGALRLRVPKLERVDCGFGSRESPYTIDAVRRYGAFRDHWSGLAKHGDKTLEIVWSAVVDERSFCTIDASLALRHGTARQATVRGLRDYCARAGWINGKQGQEWMADARLTFARAYRLPGQV